MRRRGQSLLSTTDLLYLHIAHVLRVDPKMVSIVAYVSAYFGDLLLVFGAVFLAVYFLGRRQTYDVSDGGRTLPPAVRSLPIVGSLPFLPTNLRDFVEFCISPKNKLGNVFSFRLGTK